MDRLKKTLAYLDEPRKAFVTECHAQFSPDGN